MADDQIDTLNSLLKTTIDSVDGYENSAQELDSNRLREIFRQNASDRQEVVQKLRDEVRRLVVARNERRMRRGETPLDVEAETERQLADFVGSR